MEQLGSSNNAAGRQMTAFFTTIHHEAGQTQALVRGRPNLSSAPFWFGGLWTPDRIGFIFGETLETAKFVTVFNCPSDLRGRMFMQAGLAMGGGWPGPAPEQVDTAAYLYALRAYQFV